MGNDTTDHEMLILVNQTTGVMNQNILKILEMLPKIEDRISALEKADCVKTEQITTVKSEVEKLRTQNVGFSLVNTVLIFIAGYLGVSVK